VNGDEHEEQETSADAPAQEQATDSTEETASGEDRVTDELREQLAEMRAEADRIATLGTGDEQVEAAERFAGDAGTLDERIGAAARDTDEDRGR
jgi:acetylornithine/succinyldiaminopimelate/putrescine aminotransferase